MNRAPGWLVDIPPPENVWPGGLVKVCAMGYRFHAGHQDQWSLRFNDFKRNESAKHKAAAAMAIVGPSLFRHLELDAASTIVVPVLESKETKAAVESRNSVLVRAIAYSTGAFPWTEMLGKKEISKLQDTNSLQQRRALMKEASYSSLRAPSGYKSVLIVDDILTSGTTVARVAAAIGQSNASVRLFAFVLGRHQRLSWSPISVRDANSRIPADVAAAWDRVHPDNT